MNQAWKQLLPRAVSSLLVAALGIMGSACGDAGPDAEVNAARILSFTSSPERLEASGEATLSWRTVNAASIAITRDGDPVELGDVSPGEGSIEVTVEATTVFELIATGAVGVPAVFSLTVQVDEAPGPAIGSFTADEAVEADEAGKGSVLLSWTGVLHATELVLEAEPGSVHTLDPSQPSGSIEVEIGADTTFTLVARDASLEVRESLSVRLVGEPVIEDLSVDRDWVGTGEGVTASWSTRGAVSVELWFAGLQIEGVEPTALAGSHVLTPAFDETLELRAFNEFGTMVSWAVELTVASPEVVSFAGEPEQLWLGHEAILSWVVHGATELSLVVDEEAVCGELDPLGGQSSCSWAPAANGSYRLTLTATNASGVDSMEWILFVGSGPTIESFTVLPAAITLGDEVTASWTVLPDPDGTAPTLSLEDDRGTSYPLSAASGSMQIPLTAGTGSYAFTLGASTPHELSIETEQTASVMVYGAPAASLTATPPVFDDSQGEEVLLSWTSENAASLVLFELTQEGPVELWVIPEAERGAGSFSVTIDEPTSYLLVATNAAGATAEAEETVELAPVEVLSFEADPAEIVVGQPVNLSWTTRMSREISLDLFEGPYVRGESLDAYLDVEALGGDPIPLTTACGAAVTTIGCSDTVSLDFAFPFNDTHFDQLRIYGNGFVSFELAGLIQTAGPNLSFPTSPSVPGRHVHLAPFWDELRWSESYPTGNIFLLHRSDPVEGASVVIQWKDVGLVAHPAASLNFELILWESGAFEYRYGAMDPGINPTPEQILAVEGRGATIGYQVPVQATFEPSGQAHFDVRQFNQDVAVRGSLHGRTFTWSPTPALTTAGSFVWHPYLAPGAASATLAVDRDGVTDEETVTVTVHERPEFRLVQRPPAQIEVATDFRIGWTSAYASALEVVDQDGATRCTAASPQAVSSSFCNIQEAVEGVYRYTVRATGALGFVTERTVEVKVFEPFGIESFEADETSLEHGESVVLSWVTDGATTLHLTGNGVDIPLGGSPSGPGSIEVSDLEEDTTFVLRATNAIGAVKEASLLVEMWTVRLTLTPATTTTRPGEPVSVSVEALPLDGSSAPTVFGTLPMAEVMEGSDFQDISLLPGTLPLIFHQPTLGYADVQLPAGFSFPYFGVPRQSLRVFVGGYVSFDMEATPATPVQGLPTTDAPADTVHLAPYWDGLWLTAQGSIWAHAVDVDTFIVQWSGMNRTISGTSPFDLNFQIVLHRDGSFEYRYGAMTPPSSPHIACKPDSCYGEANGSRATIGYQAPGGVSGLMIHRGGSQAREENPVVEGGLSHRTFRYELLQGNSTVTYEPIRSATYQLCTMSNGSPACKSFEIEAGFGIDAYTLDDESIGFNGSTTIRWETQGGTELTIVDGSGATIVSTTTASEIDVGSVLVTPAASTTYRMELSARSNRAVIVRELEVVRAAITVSAPASTSASQPVTVSWTLSTPDTSLRPVMFTPMEEVQGLDFYDLDLTTETEGVVEIFSAGQPNTTPLRELEFAPGFTFDFFGTQMERIWVSVRGYMSFDPATATGNSVTSNNVIPNSATVYQRMHIVPFWDELVTFSFGRVLAKQINPDTYVIQWSDVSLARGLSAANPASLNFMVVLHRGGDFEYRYGLMSPPASPATGTNNCFPTSCINEVNGSSASIGYQEPTGNHGYAIHLEPSVPRADAWPVSGGLSGRSWKFTRYTGSGSVQVAPWNSWSHPMCAIDTVTGLFFCADEPVEIRVDWGIRSFEAGPWDPKLGDPVTLSWEVVAIDELRVLANGAEIASYTGASVPATHTMTHTPTEDTTYTLEARSLDRVLAEPRLVQVKTFDLALTAPTGSLVPGVEVDLGWTFTPTGSGAADVASPMGEIPAGAGQAGAFVDISAMGGTKLTVSSDSNGYANVTLPFSFPYFRESYTQAQVYVDGYISFDLAGSAGRSSNTALPNSSANEQRIHLAPFWDDLYIRGTDAIWTHSLDANTFVIQWKNFNRSAGSTASVHYDLNFQVVLFADGSFDYRYDTMAPPAQPFSYASCWPDTCELEANGSSATIGYQTVDGLLAYEHHFGSNTETTVVPFDGGLEKRSFRFNPAASGTAKIKVGATRDYQVCGRAGAFYDCRTVTIQAVADPGDLMFTELMIDPAGGAGGQWVEVRNLSKRTIDLEGFVLQGDSGSHVIGAPLPIAPGAFGVLAASTSAGVTPDYVYGTDLSLSTTVDMIELSVGTASIASVRWGGSWFIPRESSLSLDPSHHWLGVVSNDVFEQWCEDGAQGSPGRLGGGCAHIQYDLDAAAIVPFLDISSTGTSLRELEATYGYARLDLPGFSFPFFNEVTSRFWVAAQGWISFSYEDPGGGSSSAPRPGSPKLPNIGTPRPDTHAPIGPIAAPFWASMRCLPEEFDCGFRYALVEYEGEHVLVFDWRNFEIINAVGGRVNVQAQLYENGDVAYVFGDMDPGGHDPLSSAGANYRGAQAWSMIENVDHADYISVLQWSQLELAHRSFLYMRK